MKINTKIRFVEGNFNTETGELVCVIEGKGELKASDSLFE